MANKSEAIRLTVIENAYSIAESKIKGPIAKDYIAKIYALNLNSRKIVCNSLFNSLFND